MKAFAIVRVSIEPEDVAHLKAGPVSSFGGPSTPLKPKIVHKTNRAEETLYKEMDPNELNMKRHE